MEILSKTDLLTSLQPYQGEPIPVKMVFDDLLLVISKQSLYLIGEKYGHWEIFESIERSQIQRIEYKDNFLGQKVVIVAKGRRYELKDIPPEVNLGQILQVEESQEHLVDIRHTDSPTKDTVEESSNEQEYYASSAKMHPASKGEVSDSQEHPSTENSQQIDQAQRDHVQRDQAEPEDFLHWATADLNDMTYEEFSKLYDRSKVKNDFASRALIKKLEGRYPEFGQRKKMELLQNQTTEEPEAKSGCSGCFSILRIAFVLYVLWKIFT